MANESEIWAPLTEVFRDTFGDDSIMLSARSTADDIDGWDSLGNVRLMVAVEQQFGIKFTTQEITTLRNVGEFVRLIAAKMR